MDHSNHTLLQAGNQIALSDRMRELLSRASQDHVYEQRTQGAVLDEIRQRLEGMEWLLREVRERELGGLSGAMETVSDRLDEITSKPPEWAEGLAQHVELVRDHVDVVGGRVQAVIEGTRGFADTMAAFSRHLDQIQGGMEAAAGRFTRIDKAISELAQRTERLENGMLDLTTTLNESVSSVSLATDRIAAATEQVTEQVSAKIDGVSAMVERQAIEVIGRLDGLDGRIETVNVRLADIDTRMIGVEARIGATDGKLSTIDGRLSRHDDRFDVLEGRIDARFSTVDEHIGAAEGRMTGRMDAAARRFEEVNERLDAVDDRVEAVNQRVGQLPALLEISELHKNVGEIGAVHGNRFDLIDGRLTEAASAMAPLLEVVRTRPDRDQIAETVTGAVNQVVQPAHGELTHRLGALEETLLALAEALLRPTRAKD